MNEQGEYQYDIFISYSHTDREWVQGNLLQRLERSGLSICIDYRDFALGVPILYNIKRAVDNSRCTLLVLTPSWLKSEWAEFESLLLGTANPSGRQRRLIPLMLEHCALPSHIQILTHADFTNPHDHEAQFSRLLSQLQSISVVASPSSAEVSPFIAGPPIT